MDNYTAHYPDWGHHLRNLYWFVRNSRSFFRELRMIPVTAECDRLISSGIDPLLIALLCDHLMSPNDPELWQRFDAYQRDTQATPLMLEPST